MKCENCGTRFNGNYCPNCSTPAPEQPKKKKKWISVVIAVVVILGIIGAIGDKKETDGPKNVNSDALSSRVEDQADEADGKKDESEKSQPAGEDVDQPEIVSSINDYLDDSWGGETSAKMNGDGLSIVICAVGEIPDFLDAAQTVVTSVTNMAAEADISTCVVTVKQSLDSSAQILLTFINGKLSFRADANIELDSAPESTIPIRDTANETLSQKNAVEKAISYINLMPFSHKGLIEQLEYEKFSYDDAAYGATYCGADWYEQAVLKAASYLDLMSFSHDGLVEQLEYDGFTHDQAVYGVEKNGLY